MTRGTPVLERLRSRLTELGAVSPQAGAVFFDLDGTLADTATDLAMPVNAMRIERGLEPLPLADLRPFASMGARGLIGKGLGIDKEDSRFPALRDEFLRRYEDNIVVHTHLFDGMAAVLDSLDACGWRWGIVSNKIERYVRIIMQRLQLTERSVAIVGGDTAGFAKPHPAPLLYAAGIAAVNPRSCIYVGDDERDIQAGRAADMLTVAAAYGYCGQDSLPQSWRADATIEHASALMYELGLR